LRPPLPTLFPYTTLFRSEARNQAEALVHSSEKSLKDYGDKVSEGDRTAIQDAITALRTALEGEDADDIQAKSTALAEASMKLGRSEEHTSELQSRENLVC